MKYVTITEEEFTSLRLGDIILVSIEGEERPKLATFMYRSAYHLICIPRYYSGGLQVHKNEVIRIVIKTDVLCKGCVVSMICKKHDSLICYQRLCKEEYNLE